MYTDHRLHDLSRLYLVKVASSFKITCHDNLSMKSVSSSVKVNLFGITSVKKDLFLPFPSHRILPPWNDSWWSEVYYDRSAVSSLYLGE